MSITPGEFIESLTSSFPELRSLLETHLADNAGEVLHHVFLGEVVFWLVKLYSAHKGDHESMLLIHRLITFIEDAFVRGDEATQELIAVSFVENLPSTGEPGASIRQFLGPALEEQFQRLNW